MKTLRSIEPVTEPLVAGLQIAKHYDVNVATVRRWRREGMPCHRYNAKMIRYRFSEVDAWLNAKGAQPRPYVIPPHERKAKVCT